MRIKIFLALLLISSVFFIQAVGAENKTNINKSTVAKPRIASWWFKRHAENIELFEKTEIELLMVGDSITENFRSEKHGLSVWKKHFVPRKAVNLGFGGDRTEHVLWRLDHLPKLKKAPKAAVLMIGTNNICWGSDKPKQAAEGVQTIAKKLKQLYPDMELLVLGVFPRRHKPTHGHRKEIIELNSYLPDLLKGMKGTKFLDIGDAFLEKDGTLPKEIMPDGTHPSTKGHQVWADAIESELKRMLGE